MNFIPFPIQTECGAIPRTCIHPTPLPGAGCNTKSFFKSKVHLVRIQCFPSLRLVAIPKLKSPICPHVSGQKLLTSTRIALYGASQS